MFLSRHPLMSVASPFSLKRNPISARLYRNLWDRRHRRRDPKFVFVATTGRSGTEFIQKVFSTVPGCTALHEAWPIMHDHVLRAWNDGEEWLAQRTYWVQKSVNIRRMTGENDLYVETNHLFIKSFAPMAIQDFGHRLRIIHLRRDPVSVARSMVQLGAIPGTPHGNDWYLDYRAPRNMIKMEGVLGSGGDLDHDFFRCLWYWYEIEARIRALKVCSKEIPWFNLDWEKRIPLDELVAMVRSMGKEPDMGALEELVGVKVNRQIHLKENSGPPQESLDDMHLRFQETLREKGFLPILPG